MFLSLSEWLIISIPIGLLKSLNFLLKAPAILPRPQPISKILVFLWNRTCLETKKQKASMYFLDDSQLL